MAQMPLLECDSLFSGNSNREATPCVISRVCSIEETINGPDVTTGLWHVSFLGTVAEKLLYM